MARFKYLGPKEWPLLVKIPGKTEEIVLHLKNGTTQRLTPVPPKTFFAKDEDIGYDITDERVIRHLSAHPRFVRIS